MERVIHKEIVYTHRLFMVLCWYVSGQMGALKSGVREYSEEARFIGFACQISLEILAYDD